VGVKVGESGVSVTQDSAAENSADDQNSQSSSVHFSVELSLGTWHQMSLGVYRRHVTLHVDCQAVMTSPWRRLVASGNVGDASSGQVRSSIVLSIGKAFIESSRYPTFEVSSPMYRMYLNTEFIFLVVQRFGVGLVIERSMVRLPAGALSSQLGQLSLPSLRGR